MKCVACQQWLSPWMEGELGERRKREIEEHLAQCAVCREEWQALAQMQTQLAQWGEEIESAPPEVWSRLTATLDAQTQDSQLGNEKGKRENKPQNTQNTQKQNREKRFLAWGEGRETRDARIWSWRAVAVAAALLLLVGAGWLLWPKRTVVPVMPMVAQHHPQQGVKTLPQKKGGRAKQASPARKMIALQAALHELTQAARHYEKAIVLLEQAARARLRQDTPQGRLLLRTLAELDRAVNLCREAIRHDPRAPEPQRILLAVYQRKVEVLRDVVLGT